MEMRASCPCYSTSFQQHLPEAEGCFPSSWNFSEPFITTTRHQSSSLDTGAFLPLVILLILGGIYAEHWTKCFLLSVPAWWPAWGETVTALLKHPRVQGALLVLLMRALRVSVTKSHFQSRRTSPHGEAALALECSVTSKSTAASWTRHSMSHRKSALGTMCRPHGAHSLSRSCATSALNALICPGEKQHGAPTWGGGRHHPIVTEVAVDIHFNYCISGR